MTHLEAQNKIKAATTKLALTMQKSRRPAPVPTATPRMDSPMPVIPHQKLLLSTPVKAPASPAAAALSPPGQRGQYNSPIGLYSPETLKEMMLMQGKLGDGVAAAGGVSPLGLELLYSKSGRDKSGVGKRAPDSARDDDGKYHASGPPHWVIANTAAKGPGGKATIVHAQYNTPISMYSQDAIMDAIAGQSQAKGHDSSVLPVKDPVVDCASPVYQAVIRPEVNQDMSEWARRAANLQSKSFRILAHITGTEYLQDPDEEALQRSREKFESEVKGPRFAKLKNWHHGLSAQILNIQE
ncbi:hypothetical protein INR49_005566 [Caranx melampygus]|nr:hypothetical protein INR49_005566 [Caranx melampygus]